MFKNFDISSFKKMKPSSDNSFDTAQEIKALKKIPLKKEYVKKYDDIESAFKKTAKEVVAVLPVGSKKTGLM